LKEVNDILKDIHAKKVKPVYVFDGEEPYYMDVLCDAFEQKVLQPHEKDFNLHVMYGKDSTVADIVNTCRQYPAFAEKQVVVLKEAAQLKNIADLENYILNPSASTVLVIAHKYKKVDGRGSFGKNVKKHTAYVTFDKTKDYNLASWITDYCVGRRINLNPRNAELLATYLGNDLQKIVNELEKVQLNIAEGQEITEELIEKFIGISKEYNVFEYPTALLTRNVVKTYKIVHYFVANPKDAPMVLITASLYNQFSKLYQYHYVQHLPEQDIASALKTAKWFIKDYKIQAQHYNLQKTKEAIKIIQAYNLKCIGVENNSSDSSLLKELTATLLAL
jgi:DNA polymerase-3 subunit delta